MGEVRWWVRVEEGEPLGPLAEEKILRGLVAGKVPREAQVQREGSQEWLAISTTAPFSTTVHLLSTRGAPTTLARSIAEETGALPATVVPVPTPTRWWLLACAVFFLLVAGFAGLVSKQQATRTAEGTTRELLGFLAAGDVDALRARRDLGQSRRMRAEVQKRGTQELERRKGLLEKAEQGGIKRYKDIDQRVRKAGEEDFRRLPPDERRRILEASQLRFQIERGFPSLPAQEQQALGNPEEMLDLEKKASLIQRLGERTLNDQERQQLAGDPSADPSLPLLRSRIAVAGEQEFRRLRGALLSQGREAWDVLPAAQQQRIAQKSYLTHLYTHGRKALGKEEEPFFPSEQAFFVDEGSLAKLVRALGLATLSPQERTDVEGLPGSQDEAVQGFVEAQGAAMLRDELRKSMAAGKFAVEGVTYRGRGPRSLLRSASAEVRFSFEEDAEVPARDWLPERFFLEYERGRYRAAAREGAQDPTPAQWKLLESWWKQGQTDPALQQAVQDLVAAAGRRLTGGVVGTDLGFVSLLGAIFWLLVKRREEGLITVEEGTIAAVALLVGAVQHLGQGQISADDWLATPVYLALPAWMGVRRGPRSGFVAGLLVGGVLLLGASLFRLAPGPLALLDQVPLGEFTLWAGLLASIGLLGGLTARQPVAAALAPLLWILGSALLQRDLLWSPSLHGRCALGVAFAAALMALQGAPPVAAPRALLQR